MRGQVFESPRRHLFSHIFQLISDEFKARTAKPIFACQHVSSNFHRIKAEIWMPVGEKFLFKGGQYEVRAVVDGRLVVRLEYDGSIEPDYRIWTVEEREKFNQARHREKLLAAERQDRDYQVYERHLAGETYASIGRDLGISPTRVSSLCARQRNRERQASNGTIN